MGSTSIRYLWGRAQDGLGTEADFGRDPAKGHHSDWRHALQDDDLMANNRATFPEAWITARVWPHNKSKEFKWSRLVVLEWRRAQNVETFIMPSLLSSRDDCKITCFNFCPCPQHWCTTWQIKLARENTFPCTIKSKNTCWTGWYTVSTDPTTSNLPNTLETDSWTLTCYECWKV